jgi:hypothetical protein
MFSFYSKVKRAADAPVERPNVTAILCGDHRDDRLDLISDLAGAPRQFGFIAFMR